MGWCAEPDALVFLAAGAGGAKMSGTGRGGLMIALAPNERAQAAIEAALGKLAPQPGRDGGRLLLGGLPGPRHARDVRAPFARQSAYVHERADRNPP